MSEVKTPPIITVAENGDKSYTFNVSHTWSDVCRWIGPNDWDEVVMLLMEMYAGTGFKQ